MSVDAFGRTIINNPDGTFSVADGQGNILITVKDVEDLNYLAPAGYTVPDALAEE